MSTKTSSVKLHLRNGTVFVARYFEGEYDDLYDTWYRGGTGVMAFENCCVRANDVVLIEYLESGE